MKSKFLLLFALVPLVTGLGFAQRAATAQDRPTVIFKTQVDPIFPRSLIDLGVTAGEARIAISIDTTGQVVDHLVVAYTHPDFAEAAVNAIKKWEFQPPQWHGENVSVQREMRFDFDAQGVVIRMDVSSYVAMRAMSIFSGKYEYRPSSMQEIDRIPTPLSTPEPMYPQSLIDAKKGALAVIEFYIDEQGVVRMPSVVQTEDMDAAVSAVLAVKEWKFEPPTRNGRPVLVKVQQTFRYKAPEAPAATAQTADK